MPSFKAIWLALCAPSLIWSAIVQPRAQTVSVCNADNCLRQLRSNSVKASPYCTSYLGNAHPVVRPTPVTVYTTVIATVFHVGTGTAKSDYVTRKITPYTPPGQKKRELTDALAPTPTAALELRQAALPTFASSCGGDSSRVSSACTCLIGVTAEPSTTTIARTSPGVYTTVNVCPASGAAYNYYLRDRNDGGFESYYNNAKTSFVQYPGATNINACCSKCFHTPECATYNLDPSTNECQFNSVISSNEQSNDANCPAGLAEIYAPFSQPFNNTYGLGLCSYLLQSDE